ncbi:hypothetical protein C9374_001259 [Naegleria lovaniensis]|uniref:C2 domain-containing protein n=1 Tax=Naegleria lovaniensis TaxID=51637 RepID=A0AA88GRR2_NAELO|nr:uncharacterized protein C9374_001259 [Naegleria lovaniensis]KAG2387665.1 hypothetical protein C9374_001259 [Naegleria lovaniensis]
MPALLHVKILEGRDLLAKDVTGSSDPQKANTTSCLDDEEFDLPVSDPLKEMIVFDVYDKDLLTQDDLLGYCSVPLNTLRKGVKEKLTLTLMGVERGSLIVELFTNDFGRGSSEEDSHIIYDLHGNKFIHSEMIHKSHDIMNNNHGEKKTNNNTSSCGSNSNNSTGAGTDTNSHGTTSINGSSIEQVIVSSSSPSTTATTTTPPQITPMGIPSATMTTPPPTMWVHHTVLTTVTTTTFVPLTASSTTIVAMDNAIADTSCTTTGIVPFVSSSSFSQGMEDMQHSDIQHSLLSIPDEVLGLILSFSTMTDGAKWRFSKNVSEFLLRRGHVAISLDDTSKVLVFGGYGGGRHHNDLFEIDIDSNTVTCRACDQNDDEHVDYEDIIMGRSFCPVVKIATNRYLIHGGYCNYTSDGNPNLSDAWILDTSDVNNHQYKFTKFKQQGQVPPAVESHSLVYYNGHVILYGGSSVLDGDDLGQKYSDVYVLNIETGQWSKLRMDESIDKHPGALTGHSCHMIENTNQMILYGGYNRNEETNNNIWILHIVLPDETRFFKEYSYWEQVTLSPHNTFLPHCTLYHRSVLVENKKLFVYGGSRDWNNQQLSNQFVVFDLEKKIWKRIDDDKEYFCCKTNRESGALLSLYGHTLTYLPQSKKFVATGGTSFECSSDNYKSLAEFVGVFHQLLQ